MRDTERVPLDVLEEIVQLKRGLRDLRATTLKRIHNLGRPTEIVYYTANATWTKADYPGLRRIRLRVVLKHKRPM